jgi:hypothetical protein
LIHPPCTVPEVLVSSINSNLHLLIRERHVLGPSGLAAISKDVTEKI